MKFLKDVFPGILIPVFFSYNALVYFTGRPEITRLYLAAFISIIGFIYCRSLLNKKASIFLFIIMTIICGMVSIIYNNNMEPAKIAATVMYISMALIMLNYKMHYHGSKLLFYAISIFFLSKIFNNVLASEAIYHVSRNYISVIMLVAVSLLYLSAEDNNREISVIPAILCVLISIWGIGRGGIISSGILLIGICSIKVFTSNEKKKKRFFMTILIVFIIIWSIFIFDFNLLSRYFMAFQTKGMDTPRIIMWEEYFKATEMSYMNVILGAPVRNIAVIEMFYGNTHNSFIQMHASYGLMFSIVNILLIINSIIFFLKRKKYIYVVLILTLIVRAFTDRLLFSGYAEPLLFYYEFYPLVKAVSSGERLEDDEEQCNE